MKVFSLLHVSPPNKSLTDGWGLYIWLQEDIPVFDPGWIYDSALLTAIPDKDPLLPLFLYYSVGLF